MQSTIGFSLPFQLRDLLFRHTEFDQSLPSALIQALIRFDDSLES